MKTFETIEQSLGTKKAIVISVEDYEHKGQSRKWIKVKKSRGQKVYTVAQYENGRYGQAF